jgi:hypothetical protein
MLERPAIALIGSPLLGPAVWEPVDERLRALGWRSRLLEVPSPERPPDKNSILVAHSNAGAYLPSLAVQSSAVALVFVDAILPAATGFTPLAPEAALPQLAALADSDGLLPPWTAWWDDADVAALFPDEETRRRIEAEQPRVPLTYFGQSIDAPEGWDDRPAAYLAFGDTYATERAAAESRGWPTQTLAGNHLHMLVDPDAVTAAILGLVTDGLR